MVPLSCYARSTYGQNTHGLLSKRLLILMTSDYQTTQRPMRGPSATSSNDELIQQGTLLKPLFQWLPTAVMIWRLEQLDDPASLRLVMANEASLVQVQMDLHASVGRRMIDIYPEVPMHLLQTYAQVVISGQMLNLGEIAFGTEEAPLIYELQVLPLHDHHIAIIHTDITDRRRIDEAMRKHIAQEELLRAQNAALAELSTPLIPISDEVMVMPLIGALDSRRAQQVITTLLEGIAESRAHVAILDITGVPVVDTQVANALIRAAHAVKLLGAQVILTGIRPEVAQTLVGLGADLSMITTQSSLQSGIAYATRYVPST
ncbi:MAG: STAS domain-containing protein [Oscillochloris sp.]|nr:STAS domain-containing protein [Oscillochloris sp.]